jgi:hypothetical protein
MKFVRLAAAVAAVGAVLAMSAPAQASLVLVSGPNQGSFTNNFGFGADGNGSAANPNANYWTGPTPGYEAYGSHLNNAPVAFLFVFGPKGQVSTYTDSTVGAYENVEDTQIGVLNLSGGTLTWIKLTGGADTFAFDDDGISNPANVTKEISATGAGAPGNTADPSEYGGPITYFSTTPGGTALGQDETRLIRTAYANFIGGLANGSSTYFSLEGPPSDMANLTAIPSTPTTPTPEPASLVLAAGGGLMLLGYGWQRRRLVRKK